MRRRSVPPLPGQNYIGQRRYFLTICAYQRCARFSEPKLVGALIDQLRTCSASHQLDVIAYCFMPDHVHLLVEGTTDESNLQEFVRVWKQRTAYAARRTDGNPLWQRGYYEHILRSDESLDQTVGYVLENPIRAGLVTSAADYPWIGSFVTTLEDLLVRCHDRKEGPT